MVATQDNKRIVSVGSDLTVRIWDIEKREQVWVLQDILGICDDFEIVYKFDEEIVETWDLEQSLIDYSYLGSNEGSLLLCLAIATNRKYLVASFRNRSLRLWNLDNRRLEAMVIEFDSTTNCLAITNNTIYIALDSPNNPIEIWNCQHKRRDGSLIGHTDFVGTLVVTGDERYLISGSNDCTTIIWNLQNHMQESVLRQTSYVISLAITSNNKYIITCLPIFC